MKKILFLIPNLAHGGAERVLVNLVNNLDKSKFDVTVQTLFDVGVNRKYLDSDVTYIPGFKWQFRGNSQIQKLIPAKLLFRRIVKGKYDIIVSYLEGITSRIVSACDDPNTKKVCFIHTELIDKKKAAMAFRNMDEARRCYGSFDVVVGVSRRVAEKVGFFFPNQQNIKVLYNTNETERIREKALVEPSDAPFCKEILSVCSVGRLIPVKGFERLLAVHRRLLDEGYAHKVYILGIGELEAELKRKAQDLGVADSFILLGYQDNPYQYVSRCDLYVCSSYREGFSTAVTESLIVGTPVVSTDCSGAKELLGEQNEYGIVVENSEDGLYQGMKQLLGNPQLLAHYKEQAALRGSYFSREKTVKAVENMLESLS